MLLLIGGDGFLGRHLRDALVTEKTDKIYIISGTPKTTTNSTELFVPPSEFSNLIRSATEDIDIIYFAWSSVPGTYANTPWSELEYNVRPLIDYLDKAKFVPRLRFVFISSGGTVYGNMPEGVRATEHTALNPISSYGLTKVCAEQSVQFFGRSYKFPTTILRVSNPVGRHQVSKVQGVVPALFRAIRDGRPFTAFGKSIIRDYVDADDVADAIIMAVGDRSAHHAIWNVGSGVGHSVADIVAIVEQVTSGSIEVHEASPRPFDVSRIVLDCSRIETDLGWRPTRDLRDTIREMWQTSSRDPR
ncbi:MAG: GDP-mannose 4,6-dehydratase [Rhodoblastus sp.]